ncbi:FUSC family protein [Jeongeupia wiesaeckerbachi]|uniref:FUSC family protein n=1 Tax=Jeongeupia wiesaeckerbachi TaxID=3051218 RepID=UPI003D800881
MFLHPALTLQHTPINRRRMLRAVIAVGLPLAIALMRGEFLPAVYGAVAGFYTLFVDSGGDAGERLAAILYMTVGMLLAGIAGVVGHSVPGASLVLLLGFTAVAGWLQGAGNAVEFIGKYWLIAFLFGDSAPDLPPLCGTYLIVGGLAGMLAVLVDLVIARRPEPQSAPMLRDAARHLLRRRHTNGAFTFYFMVLVVTGYAVGHWLGLTRAYWVPLTIVIVTVYDPRHSIHKLIQRLAGSLIGAVLGALIVHFVRAEWALALCVTAMAAWLPAAQARNYWVAVIPITALVMVLLDFGILRGSMSATGFALARMVDTVVGCVVCGLGAMIYLRLLPSIEAAQSPRRLQRKQRI